MEKVPGRAYELPGGMKGVRRPSVGDLILDREESKRHTKTFFRTDQISMLVEFIMSHGQGLIKTLQHLHKKEHGVELTTLEVLELYPGAKRWADLHQGLVEHFASTEGFSVVAAVRAQQQATLDQKQAPESSIAGGPSVESK